MYIEMNPTGLTLSDLICVAHRKRSEDTGFPYAVQSCRCSNCRYVSEGKCSLKECCCMAERVKAHTCTFAEILHTCFANVKDDPHGRGQSRYGQSCSGQKRNGAEWEEIIDHVEPDRNRTKAPRGRIDITAEIERIRSGRLQNTKRKG